MQNVSLHMLTNTYTDAHPGFMYCRMLVLNIIYYKIMKGHVGLIQTFSPSGGLTEGSCPVLRASPPDWVYLEINQCIWVDPQLKRNKMLQIIHH